MNKSALAAISAVPILLLGYCNVPETSCTANWRDIEGENLIAPVDVCRHEPDIRKIGGMGFTRVGEDVYRVDRWKKRIPGGPLCLVGVGCFPLYERPQLEREFLLVRLQGSIDLARMRSYLDDRIFSDGSVVFDSLQRVPPLEPALDLTKLRLAFPGHSVPMHMTDGRWVLYDGQILRGADPSTLEEVPIGFLAPGADSYTHAAVVRDRHAVFFRTQRIDGADPATFILVHYSQDQLHPGMDLPGSGWIGLDRRNAWHLSNKTAQPLELSKQHYRDLRQELTRLQILHQLAPPNQVPD